MSESLKIALTALLTVAVFVAGQIIQRIFIEPVQEIRRTIGRIAHALTFYSNVGAWSSSEEMNAGKENLRKLASDLRAGPHVIPFFYGLFAILRLVPSRDAIKEASAGLVGWSNSLHGDSNEHRRKVAQALSLLPEFEGIA